MWYSRLIIIFILLLAGGCTTEFNPATGRQESLMYGDDKEKSIGASVALQVEKTMPINTEIDINERVEKILAKIVSVADRQDVVYSIRVIDEDEMNAFSLPGGYIYINKGLIDRVGNDDQLAAVIAHELAHVVAKHSMKRLQGAYGATLLTGAAIFSGSGELAAGVSLASSSLLFQNSREDEFEADRLGIKYMRQAGYDSSQMKPMLRKLSDYQDKQSLRPLNYWRTHPYLPQRMARADAAAKDGMEFRDYLNITGEER